MPQDNPVMPIHRIAPTNAFVPFPKDEVEQSVPCRFESIVRRYPERLAIKTRDHSCTYEELNQAANRVAHAILAARGPGAEPVALLLDQGVPAIASIFGVLKTGKFYVPLNPTLPPARLTTMLADVQPRLLITDTPHMALPTALVDQGVQVLLTERLMTSPATDNPGLQLAPDTLAEVLYTSGSTGQPKGVMRTHRNILHHCMRDTNALHLSPNDRMTLFASLGTGQARGRYMNTLLNGAALYPHHVKEEGLAHLAAWLAEEDITIYHSSATLFRAFVDTLAGGETFPTLRLVRVGSEPVSSRDVELYKAHFSPDCLLVNALSSTETGTIRIYLMDHETPLHGTTVPVGYAVDGMEVLLLGEDGADVVVNQPGEIVVKSRYLSPGYWRRPDLTASVFLPDPAGGEERLYRTRDLGIMLPDGCLVHLGRTDFRVMVRGYSIEVAEIEQVLRSHEAVKDVIVMARPNHVGEQHLVAYVVPTRGPGPGIEALQDMVRKRLPDYMVPAAFIQLDALPLTPSGKVDRQQLPAPERVRPQLRRPYVAPRTPVEQTLLTIWAEMLGTEPIGIHDAFLELGSDSLLAMRLVARVRTAFQAEVPLRTLLEAPTIAAMAVAITQCLAHRVDDADMARWLSEIEEPSEEQTQQQRTDDTVSST